MFNLKVSLAQREIEKTSERIKFVFNNKREKGNMGMILLIKNM